MKDRLNKSKVQVGRVKGCPLSRRKEVVRRMEGSIWNKQCWLDWAFLKSNLSALISIVSKLLATEQYPNFLDLLRRPSILLTSAWLTKPPQTETQYKIREVIRALKTTSRAAGHIPHRFRVLKRQKRWLHWVIIKATCSENDKESVKVTPRSLAIKTRCIPSKGGGVKKTCV